jgi:hypothetical protein
MYAERKQRESNTTPRETLTTVVFQQLCLATGSSVSTKPHASHRTTTEPDTGPSVCFVAVQSADGRKGGGVT